ncbi:hypothetical protein [Zavarzinella formosa]|uniref:hypothetical protein n=1 Tax=Zavarzinella formosa TaxID=360055 RepID=UPI00036469EF|nr:hypothetical protein [Zavarzinella formosa]
MAVPAPSKANTKPEALSRAGYVRLEQPDFAESELANVFGPPQEVSSESKDTKKYVWISGKTKLTVFVKDGKVISSFYPGQAEERARRNVAYQAAAAIMTPVRDYVLKNGNRFPAKMDELDLAPLKGHPEMMDALKRGEVVLPWGKSANRLVWAHWKETPQIGGPYVRFDGKGFHYAGPPEFARLEAIVLTAATIPADLIEQSKPDPGEPKTFAAHDKKAVGVSAQGFFTAGNLTPLLTSKPANADEIAKHMVRNYWHTEVLRLLEKGDLIVRWGRDPKRGVYAYPKGFPMKESWAIYNGNWAPFDRLENAQKAFDE